MKSLFALRALLRFEWRQFLRHRSRSALMLALVAIPVAVMVGGGTLFRNSQATSEELKVRDLGRAELGIEFDNYDELCRFQDSLEPDSGSLALQLSPLALGERGTIPLFSLSDDTGEPVILEESLAAGILRLRSGRMPAGEFEVALSPELSSELECPIGTTVTLGAEEEWTVTGLIQIPEDIRSDVAFTTTASGRGEAHYRLLVESDAASGIAARARADGYSVVLRSELGSPDPFVTGVVYFIGGLAFFEAGLVLAAAFAVGLRRRRRETGLLLAGGADPSGITIALLSSVAILSGLGSLLGLALGLAVAYGLHPFLEGWAGRLVGELRLDPGDFLGACCFGLFASLLAVTYPAIRASREPVLQALSGRRPPVHAAAPWVRFGVALFTLGALAMLVGALRTREGTGPILLLGSILVVAGLCATSPWILEQTARLAGPLPLAPRLAMRDAGRFRSRNAPAVTAIASAMAFFVLLAAMVSSVEELLRERGTTDPEVTHPAGALLNLALGISAGTSLLVVLVATALSAVESGHDARALQAVGARPGLLRRHAASRGAYLAWVGALLAVPGGLIPCAALVHGSDTPLRFTWPWRELFIALTVLPLLAYVSIWILSCSTRNHPLGKTT